MAICRRRTPHHPKIGGTPLWDSPGGARRQVCLGAVGEQGGNLRSRGPMTPGAVPRAPPLPPKPALALRSLSGSPLRAPEITAAQRWIMHVSPLLCMPLLVFFFVTHFSPKASWSVFEPGIPSLAPPPSKARGYPPRGLEERSQVDQLGVSGWGETEGRLKT